MRCGIAVGAAAFALVAATAGAQDGGVRAEVFFGAGGFVVDRAVLVEFYHHNRSLSGCAGLVRALERALGSVVVRALASNRRLPRYGAS